MFVRNRETKEQMVAIPVDEYAKLIECKTRLNTVYDFITNCHVISLKQTGCKGTKFNAAILEIVAGYEENENYFNQLKEEYERRRLGK